MEAACQWTTIALHEYSITPNIVYKRAGGHDLQLDVVLAGSPGEARPTLMYFHGGGWVQASKEDHALFILPYLARGMNAVNVEYRLASEALAPATVEDCRCALRWVHQHSKEYNFDTSKLVLFGESAGGHLALMTAMLEPEQGFDNECPADLPPATGPLMVACVIVYCGITDVLELLEGPRRQYFATMWFGSLPNRQELAQRLSPLAYVRPGLPPMIIVHGDDDEFVPYSQSVRLHEALDRAGVPNCFFTIPSGKHWHWPREHYLKAQQAAFEFLEEYGILSR